MAVKRLTPIARQHNGQRGDFAATIYSQEAYVYPPVSEVEATAASGDGVRAQLIGTARKWILRYGVPMLAETSKVLLSHAEYDVVGARYNNYHDQARIADGFDATVARLDRMGDAGGAAGVIATSATFGQPRY